MENFSDVGRNDKSRFKKDNKFLHKKPRHEGEWNRGQSSPTKDKPKQFQGSGSKPKGSFVKKGASFKGSQNKGNFGDKPKGFTPSLHIALWVVTSTPIYTMEVNNSSWKIEKFSGRPATISLKEFKATFLTVVCELELKYGASYTKVFAFKQLARYVHYEALDVYKQHSLQILGITQILNLAYAIAIATTSQVALQATIAHHGIVPNNLDLEPISVNLFPQQVIVVIANILPTIDALTFADPMGEFF